jgi:predicted nucleic acid-binding protein
LFEFADGYARVGRRARGLQLLAKFEAERGYRLCPITEHVLQSALNLYRGRIDKEWGLTDCVSFVLMKQERVTEALTADTIFARPASRPCC